MTIFEQASQNTDKYFSFSPTHTQHTHKKTQTQTQTHTHFPIENNCENKNESEIRKEHSMSNVAFSKTQILHFYLLVTYF